MSFLSPMYVKPAIVVITSVGIDMLIFKQTNIMNSVFYGLANGVGSFSSNMLINSGMVPNLGSTSSTPADPNKMYSVFTVEERILEITMSFGASYAVNKFILHNDGNQDIIKKIGAIVVADVIAEYATDFLATRPLSYLVLKKIKKNIIFIILYNG